MAFPYVLASPMVAFRLPPASRELPGWRLQLTGSRVVWLDVALVGVWRRQSSMCVFRHSVLATDDPARHYIFFHFEHSLRSQAVSGAKVW